MITIPKELYDALIAEIIECHECEGNGKNPDDTTSACDNCGGVGAFATSDIIFPAKDIMDFVKNGDKK